MQVSLLAIIYLNLKVSKYGDKVSKFVPFGVRFQFRYQGQSHDEHAIII